jgi:transmembrane sensor
LSRGEALFSVTHDPARPFVVDSGAGRIVDVGTRFDVETTVGWTRVAVLEGSVALRTGHGTATLTAGRAGGYDNAGVLSPVAAADESVTLWSTGRRRFNSEPLPDVLDRLARYHGVSFVLADPSLRKLQVSGTFRVDDLPLFLRTLSAALPVRATATGPQRFEIAQR